MKMFNYYSYIKKLVNHKPSLMKYLSKNECTADLDLSQFSLHQKNKHGENVFFQVIHYNFTKEQINYLLRNVDLLGANKYGTNVCKFVLQNNQYIGLDNEQLDYLIKNSDLLSVDSFRSNTLMLALKNNRNLKLTNKQWDYLIENSAFDKEILTIIYLFAYQKQQCFSLEKDQISKVLKKFDLINNAKLLTTMLYHFNKTEYRSHFQVFWKEFEDKNSLLYLMENRNSRRIYDKFINLPCVISYKEKQQLNDKISHGKLTSKSKVNKI